MSALAQKFRSLNLKDSLTIVHNARKGVSTRVFYLFSITVNLPEKHLAALLHIHPRTISNYKDQKKHLNPVEGEHLLKLIYLFTTGEDVFGSVDQFNQWLNTPAWQNNEKPMAYLNTPGGVDLVQDELLRLSYGYVV